MPRSAVSYALACVLAAVVGPAVVLAGGCGPATEIGGQLAVGRVDAGTSTTTPDAGPRPRPDGGPGTEGCADATLTSIRAKIFFPSCATPSCHIGPGPAKNLDLTASLAELSPRLRRPSLESSSGLLLVKPGQVGASYLYLKVFLETPPSGERMPNGGAPLEACQLEALRDWITAGAPD